MFSKFLPRQRDSQLLLDSDNFTYSRKKNLNKDTPLNTAWRCSKNRSLKCHAMVYLDTNNALSQSLPRGTTLQPGARLDILARGFYSPMERAFFDVRVSHPGAPTNNVFETPVEMYADHEDKKMKKYNHRVIQIEKGTFAPLCFSTTGGMGPQAMVFVKKLAKHMTRTSGQTLSNTMAYIRRTLRFELLKATLIAVRGHRGKYYEKALPIEELDINLVEEASNDDV